MTDRRVLFLSATALLIVLAGLLVLALPDPYEGGVLYDLDAAHSIRELDGIGLALLVMGGAASWWAGMLWQRRMVRL